MDLNAIPTWWQRVYWWKWSRTNYIWIIRRSKNTFTNCRSIGNERNQAETTCRGNGASLFCTLQRRNLQPDQESQHTMWKAYTTKPHVMSMTIWCDICTSNQRVTIQLHMTLASDQQLTYKTAYECNSNPTSLHWKSTANVLTSRLE